MPLETLFSNPAPSSSRRSAILSRLNVPLANRNRHVSEFYVEPDDPWKSFYPGETVKGCVVLNIAKPLPITHLVVCLHGHARVYKNHVAPSEGSASGFLGPGRGTRGVEYLGNGFTSLFQDEVVLCGEGLLKKGIYKFKFELGFPPTSLPSSIDFERGNVAYYVTATLTRPTTIAPTVSCDRRVLFQDSIDVGHIPSPKPRVISLEPISRRGMVKAKVTQTSLDKVQVFSSPTSPKRTEIEQGRLSNSSLVDQPPLSPATSDISSTSGLTNSSQSFQIVNHSPQTTGASTKNSETKSTSTSKSSKAITATTELLKSGVLPGDVVPLKISITHTKSNIRGLIIVTLYRQGRIDTHPPIPLTSRGKGKKPEYEDVYPRSRTGLGGLHFSNSSPNSVFRKDLCQTSAMMVINPQTLTADVRISIRVPDDAFPTMNNVPGGMIEFKYYVEVVIDLCGKLGESRFLPRISLTSPPQSFTNPSNNDSGLQVTSNWANNILDTAQLRRGKNIVVCLFEVTVGSKDSSKVSKRCHDETPTHSQWSSSRSETDQLFVGEEYYDENGHYNDQYHYDSWSEDISQPERDWTSVARFVAPPEPEEEVDEKTRLRRQEALLLPSQPPNDNSSSSAEATAPSAPFVPEEDVFYENYAGHGGQGDSERAALSVTSARSAETLVPSYFHSHPTTSNGYGSHSPPLDKQELERQRLIAQVSAPPADGDSSGGAGRSELVDAPSAPILTEEDEYNAHTLNQDHIASDNLPQYRR